VLRDLYEGLTTDGPLGQVVPGVAESWEVDKTGKVYTFKLRKNASWSDGTIVSAHDFVTAWRRVVDPKQACPVADNLRLVSGATAIINGHSSPETLGVYARDESTLVVELEQPAPYFPQLLSNSATYPFYSGASNSAVGARKKWVSNGPYVLADWLPGSKLILTKNIHYWDSNNVPVSHVEYQIADENSQFARYRAEQLDITDTVPANVVGKLKEQNPSELVISPFLATAYFGFNLSAPPFAGNIALRQAVSMSISRARLVNAMAFGQREAFGFVPPGIWNYTPQESAWRGLSDAERISEAKRLYAIAGYSIKNPLHLRLLFNSDPVIKKTAIIIAEMWKETLGIQTELTEEEYRVFLLSRHDKSRWDLARLGWTADFNDASNFLDIFRAHSDNNDVGYVDPAFDAALDQAAQTANSSNRRIILETDEQRMLSNCPIIPLYFFVSKRLVKPYVNGIQLNPLNRIGSKMVSIKTH